MDADNWNFDRGIRYCRYQNSCENWKNSHLYNLHMLLGLILLFLFNLLPFFKIPINILTVLVAGFGGIFGVLILIIAKFLGLY